MSDESRGGGGGLGAGFVLLIFIGFVVKFWLWILAAIAAVALIALVFVLVNRSDKRRAAELEQVAAIARRADQQHAWTLAGDDRGIYGEHIPAQSIELVQFPGRRPPNMRRPVPSQRMHD